MLHVKCMKSKGLNTFVWPEKIDKLTCAMSDVLYLVSDPVKVNDRYMSLSREDYNTAEAAFNSKKD